MATVYWLDVDGNYNNTANWSTGSVPSATDTIYFLRGNKNIVTNVNQSAVTPALLHFGPEFRGTIGTPTTPLRYGNITKVIINTPYCSSLNLHGGTITEAFVENARGEAYACHFFDGDITDLYVKRAGLLRIGAAVGLTRAKFLASNRSPTVIYAIIEDGVTLANSGEIECIGGNIKCYSSLTGTSSYIKLESGLWEQLGEVNANLVNIDIHGGTFSFNPLAYGATISGTITVYGGTFDSSKTPQPRTFTNSQVRPGGVFNANNGLFNATFTNPLKNYGGQTYGVTSETQYFDLGDTGP